MKKNAFLICLLLSINLIAQNEEIESNQVVDSIEVDDSIKRISLGLKIGIPNIIGGTIQGVLPILGNQIAPYFNLAFLSKFYETFLFFKHLYRLSSYIS